MLVVSIGCPAGIGPEVSVAGAAAVSAPTVLVGDEKTILAAAELRGVPRERFRPYLGTSPRRHQIGILDPGPPLTARDRKPGKPTPRSGAAQLRWVDEALEVSKSGAGRALVTGPVSKWAIARSGAPGAKRFRGHTEWLRDRDRADAAIMCFASERLVTSLVTTHLPVARVPRALDADSVSRAILGLERLLRSLGRAKPRIAVASLNPHAGESELLGGEEARAIAPGIRAARKATRRTSIDGPIGAETAYRRALAGEFDGVVAMYHDQATIPMKIVAFGDAVNVTMGLSVVRTSVDHGTGYDIAWTGKADAEGMIAALRLAQRLTKPRRRRRS